MTHDSGLYGAHMASWTLTASYSTMLSHSQRHTQYGFITLRPPLILDGFLKTYQPTHS